MDLQAFPAAEQTILAAKYALLTISEAATKLGDIAVQLCPEIPWREVRGLGNRLRHDYGNVDVIRIWLLIERDLPALKAACSGALQILKSSDQSR
jgi:uncharacterized protein with HEPN domain